MVAIVTLAVVAFLLVWLILLKVTLSYFPNSWASRFFLHLAWQAWIWLLGIFLGGSIISILVRNQMNLTGSHSSVMVWISTGFVIAFTFVWVNFVIRILVGGPELHNQVLQGISTHQKEGKEDEE